MNKQTRQLLEDYVCKLPEQGYRPYLGGSGGCVRLDKDGMIFCPLTAVSHAYTGKWVALFQWNSCELPLKRIARAFIIDAADQEGTTEIRALLLQCLGLKED